jgi:hypothetical protein
MHADHSALLQNLALASVMVAVTVLIHFWGLIVLVRVMGHTRMRLRTDDNTLGQAALLVLVVLGLVGLHTIEIWLYAVLYVALGALQTFEESLYFSTVTFVTVGYGDVVLGKAWRLLSAIEAANGVILVAWSTAFLVAVTARLRALEHDWLKPRD